MELKNIFIISGPSGVGEDSVIEELSKRMKINRVITTSTREMRPGEKQGKPYYFITKKEFQKKIDDDEMAEWAQEYNNNYYGVTKKELQRISNLKGIGIWKMEYKGVITISKKFPNIPSILLMADSLEELERRIRKRGETDETYIRERMEYTKEWMKHLDVYDYTVINKRGKLNEAVDKIEKIIKEYSKNNNV